ETRGPKSHLRANGPETLKIGLRDQVYQSRLRRELGRAHSDEIIAWGKPCGAELAFVHLVVVVKMKVLPTLVTVNRLEDSRSVRQGQLRLIVPDRRPAVGAGTASEQLECHFNFVPYSECLAV